MIGQLDPTATQVDRPIRLVVNAQGAELQFKRFAEPDLHPGRRPVNGGLILRDAVKPSVMNTAGCRICSTGSSRAQKRIALRFVLRVSWKATGIPKSI